MFRAKSLAAIAIVFLLFTGFLPSHVNAGSTLGGVGLRAGYDPDPDQFIVGGQLILGRTMGFMRFTPSFDIGFGDNLKTYSANFDFRVIRLRPPKSQVTFYGAAGPTVTVWDHDRSGSNTEIGATITGGLEIPMSGSSHYIMEIRFGIGDVPDLRLMGGIIFGVG